MLVLSRHPGESVLIDGRILVEVIAIQSGGRIQLGFQAPPEIRIMRTELLNLERKVIHDADDRTQKEDSF